MKHLLIILFVSISATTIAQQTTFKNAWLEKWDNSRDYLIAIAEAMPEEHYDFKPTERQMTFINQLIHIKGNIEWLTNSYLIGIEFEDKKFDIPQNKNESIEMLKKHFDIAHKVVENMPEATFEEKVAFFSGPKSKLQILNLLQDHVSHHRGQLIVYLNLKDVAPPKFVGW